MRIEKRSFAKRDGNERFIEPQHFVVSDKKLPKVAGFKSTLLKAIKSHEDIEENLKLKLKKVFSDGFKKLPKQKDLISKEQ